MTVSNTTNRKVYPGNDSQTLFDFTFYVKNESTELFATVTDANGAETPLVLNVDFQVSTPSTDETGGTIRYPISGTPLITGSKIAVYREIAEAQGTSFPSQGAFLLQVVEDTFDKLIHIIQQHSDQIDRSLVFGTASAQSGINVPEPLANAALGWNPDATKLVNLLALTAGTSTSAFVDTLLGHANAADFMGGLGITAAAQTLLDDASIADMLTTLTAAGTTARNLFTKAQRFSTGTAVTNGNITAGVLTFVPDGTIYDMSNTSTVTSMSTHASGSLIILRHLAAAQWTHDNNFIKGPKGASRTSVAGDVSIWFEYSAGKYQCLFWSEHTASETEAGIVERASDAEAQGGVITTRVITPNNLGATVPGIDATLALVTRTNTTEYQNTTGKPLMVIYRCVTGSGSTAVEMGPTSGALLGVGISADSNAPGDAGTVTILVPDDWYYRYVNTGSPTVVVHELS